MAIKEKDKILLDLSIIIIDSMVDEINALVRA